MHFYFYLPLLYFKSLSFPDTNRGRLERGHVLRHPIPRYRRSVVINRTGETQILPLRAPGLPVNISIMDS